MPADVFPRIVLFLSLLAACAVSLPAYALELEAVLDAPMASSLVRSAEGRALAWVERAGGRRSIHVASAPAWEASEVYAVPGDAGEPLRGLALSLDGSHVAFSRGGGPNAFGELAKPASGALTPLTTGSGIEVSPRLLADGALARAVSPIAHIDGWRSPVLLISGDDDRNVVFEETVDLYHRLRDRDVPVEALVLPDEVHGFHRHASWLRAYRATADFLARELAVGAAP